MPGNKINRWFSDRELDDKINNLICVQVHTHVCIRARNRYRNSAQCTKEIATDIV